VRSRDPYRPCGDRPDRARRRLRHTGIDGDCGIEIGHCRIELSDLHRGASASDIGRRIILAQRDRLIKIVDRLGPGLLVVVHTSTRGHGKGILRIELDRAIEVGKRRVKIAGPLPRVAARQQSRNRLRVELKRGLRIGVGGVELGTARQQARPVDVGLTPIIRRP
jgi:hypothetical protein